MRNSRLLFAETRQTPSFNRIILFIYNFSQSVSYPFILILQYLRPKAVRHLFLTINPIHNYDDQHFNRHS
jgi:hypothetical protein